MFVVIFTFNFKLFDRFSLGSLILGEASVETQLAL